MVGAMFFVNQMFVRCAAIENGWAWLQWIDPDGSVRIVEAPVSALVPMREFLMPHTAWPTSGNLDAQQAEREERQAAAITKAERKARAKVARKARRSMKIKRAAA